MTQKTCLPWVQKKFGDHKDKAGFPKGKDHEVKPKRSLGLRMRGPGLVQEREVGKRQSPLVSGRETFQTRTVRPGALKHLRVGLPKLKTRDGDYLLGTRPQVSICNSAVHAGTPPCRQCKQSCTIARTREQVKYISKAEMKLAGGYPRDSRVPCRELYTRYIDRPLKVDGQAPSCNFEAFSILPECSQAPFQGRAGEKHQRRVHPNTLSAKSSWALRQDSGQALNGPSHDLQEVPAQEKHSKGAESHRAHGGEVESLQLPAKESLRGTCHKFPTAGAGGAVRNQRITQCYNVTTHLRYSWSGAPLETKAEELVDFRIGSESHQNQWRVIEKGIPGVKRLHQRYFRDERRSLDRRKESNNKKLLRSIRAA
uniref:Uncharacterized protein n=1 Tax=Cannabis sativa TaxID=3483 RepID=A0A803QRQ6_CANSA